MTPLVQAARAYKGTPWRHRGRTARGLDCAGLVWVAYKDCGVVLPDRRDYGRDPFKDGLKTAIIDAVGEPVWQGPKGTCRMEYLQPGDVVVMSPAGLPRHMAIVGDDPMYGLSIVHANGSKGIGKVWEDGLVEQSLKIIVCIFRRPVA